MSDNNTESHDQISNSQAAITSTSSGTGGADGGGTAGDVAVVGSPPLDYVLGAVVSVSGAFSEAVASVGEVVVSGVTTATHSVGEAVASVSSGG